MSQTEADLYDIIRQLRVELDWAARTGIIVEHVPLPDKPPLPAPSIAARSDAPRDQDSARQAVSPAPYRDASHGVERPEPPQAAPRPVPSPDNARQGAAPPPWSATSRPTFGGPPPGERPPERAPSGGPLTARTSDAPRAAPAWQSKFDPRTPGDPETRRKTEEALVALGSRPGLGQIREVLGDCTRCKLHGLGRKQIVFGVGNPKAELMFVGEGPGGEEDRLGEPFVGPAGQLLTKIIESGMGLRRGDVYIANVLKCRPPNNRDPEPDEVEQCEPFLRAQIRAIDPKVIVALGKHAAHALLKVTTPITRLRGTWSEYEGRPLMPTYHPAYLLRNPGEKRAVWEDMKEVLRRLGRSPLERGAGA